LTGYCRPGNNGGKTAVEGLQNCGFRIVAAGLWRKRHGHPILDLAGAFAGAKKSFCKDQIAIIPVVLSSMIPKSGNRFSVKIMLKPVLEPGCRP
jgi:hypothetical protein